jgi:hypothetical protein
MIKMTFKEKKKLLYLWLIYLEKLMLTVMVNKKNKTFSQKYLHLVKRKK